MGGGQSKTEVNQISKTLNDVIVSTVQSCEVRATQSQTLTRSNTGFTFWSKVKLEQQSDISSECFSSSSKQLELQNNIINTIAQTTSTKGVALLDAFSAPGATSIANLENIVRNNVTMSNIQKSYSEIKQSQEANFENSGIIVFDQIDLVQGSKIFAAAALNEISKAGIFTAIESKIDQTASTESENPLDFIGKIFSGVAGSVAFMTLGFILLIIMMIVGPFILIGIINSLRSSPEKPVHRYQQDVMPVPQQPDDAPVQPDDAPVQPDDTPLLTAPSQDVIPTDDAGTVTV